MCLNFDIFFFLSSTNYIAGRLPGRTPVAAGDQADRLQWKIPVKWSPKARFWGSVSRISVTHVG
jgi:hypothetical protein